MKLVVLTQRVEVIENIGERRDALSQEWALLAEACGFLPLPLPNHLPAVRRIMEALPVEGILLTGGNDLASYGGDAPERDEVEHCLIEHSIQTGTPLLGVCRGMQAILNYFGTPLAKVEGHVRREHRLDNGDTVNSFHSWGARACQPPLLPLAWSEDGVLEAVSCQDYASIRGVMWHPERYAPFRERDIEMIREVFRL